MGGFQKAGFVVQGQNETVDFKGHLLLIGVGLEVALFFGQHHGTVHGHQPGFDGAGQRIAHGAWAVIELDRATDVNAPGLNFNAGALHPVGKQGPQAGQATRSGHGGEEHLFLKTLVVLAHHRNLQLFTRTEVGKHARLAHLHDFGHGTDAQTLQPNMGGQPQSRIDNGSACLLPLELPLGG